MIKIHIIGDESALAFQEAINTFIKDKKVIDIKYQSIMIPKQYINGVPNRISIADRALIIYEE